MVPLLSPHMLSLFHAMRPPRGPRKIIQLLQSPKWGNPACQRAASGSANDSACATACLGRATHQEKLVHHQRQQRRQQQQPRTTNRSPYVCPRKVYLNICRYVYRRSLQCAPINPHLVGISIFVSPRSLVAPLGFVPTFYGETVRISQKLQVKKPAL